MGLGLGLDPWVGGMAARVTEPCCGLSASSPRVKSEDRSHPNSAGLRSRGRLDGQVFYRRKILCTTQESAVSEAHGLQAPCLLDAILSTLSGLLSHPTTHIYFLREMMRLSVPMKKPPVILPNF